MAAGGNIQALIAAFFFGTIVNAATAAVFLYLRSQDPASTAHDSLRRVLIVFLICAALWAQTDFIALLVDVTSSSPPCQIVLIFSSTFDQLGRVAIEQYLCWAMSGGVRVTAGQLLPQALLLLRLVFGGAFVVLTRQQAASVCLARSSSMPIALVVIGLDVVILLLLVTRTFSTGLVADLRLKRTDLVRSRSIILVTAAFGLWTATSVTMMLGTPGVDIIPMTTVPSSGLTVLILALTAFVGTLSTSRASISNPPEAPSPRRVDMTYNLSTTDSDYPPTRYEELKDVTNRPSTAFINPREVPKASDLPQMENPALHLVPRLDGLPMPPAMNARSTAALRSQMSHTNKMKGFFDFGRLPSRDVSVRKLAIGNPILQDTSQNPLNKIATIGLDQAARLEQERKAKVLQQQQQSKVIFEQPIEVSAEANVRRSLNLKRREVMALTSQQPGVSVKLATEAPASKTSSQLSPGIEELRRRSPRKAGAAGHGEAVTEQASRPATPLRGSFPPSIRPLLQPPPFPSQPPPKPVERPVQKDMVRTPILFSRELSTSPKQLTPEPVKTLLQRRASTGLPLKPKAGGLKRTKTDAAAQIQQTVLFVNEILYNDPNMVQSIIDNATGKAAQKASLPLTTLTSKSIVHRPRPIPRKPGQALGHRRSKSLGALLTAKSHMMDDLESPSPLPPLPPASKTAGRLGRLQPNHTRSMTFDEKMRLFYHPQGGDVGAVVRKGIPDVPSLPQLSYEAEPSWPARMSPRTESVLDVEEFSPYRTLDEEPENNIQVYMDMTGLDDNVGYRRNESVNKRASSPVIPLRLSTWTTSTEAASYRTQDDVFTNSDSEHSPEIAIGIEVDRQVAPRTDALQPHDSLHAGARTLKVSSMTPSMIDGRGSHVMTVMLYTEGDDQLISEDGRVAHVPSEKASQEYSPGSWHHRVGVTCPTFTDRMEKERTRKMPPPPPLTINTGSMKKTVVQHPPESSRIESPEEAMQLIQEQLKRLDRVNADVGMAADSPSSRMALLDNLEREMGDQEQNWRHLRNDLARDSMASVRTLSTIRSSLAAVARDLPLRSGRSAELGTPRGSGTLSRSHADTDWFKSPVSVKVSTWQQRLAELSEVSASPLERQGSANFLAPMTSQGSVGILTPRGWDDDDERSPVVMVMEPKTGKRGKRVEKPGQWKERAEQEETLRPATLWTSAPTILSNSNAKSLLWSPPPRQTLMSEPPSSGQPESFRLFRRKVMEPLDIVSKELWHQPHKQQQQRDLSGLWRPPWLAGVPIAAPGKRSPSPSIATLAQHKQFPAPKPARSLTQRPPRHSKRITFLPDIIENPEPLPDNRGTLGIFQFPWGEKSDTATIAPAQIPPPHEFISRAIPGTMTTSQGKAAGPSESGYSSSFFDAYDDEDEEEDEEEDEDQDDGDEDGDDDDEDEDEDEFDETTLRKIANILKTDSLPSKNSLLPMPQTANEESYVEDYLNEVNEFYVEEGEEGEYRDAMPAQTESTVNALAEEQVAEPPNQAHERQNETYELQRPELPAQWRKAESPAVTDHDGKNLPQPDEQTRGRDVEDQSRLRVGPRLTARVATESGSMWERETQEKNLDEKTPMWTPEAADPNRLTQEPHILPAAVPEALMFEVSSNSEANAAFEQESDVCILNPKPENDRTHLLEPAAKGMSHEARSLATKSIERLSPDTTWNKTSAGRNAGRAETSHGLWSPPPTLRNEEAGGLFQVDRTRPVIRTSSKAPVAQHLIRRLRPAVEELPDQISSKGLWNTVHAQIKERNWIVTGSGEEARAVVRQPRQRLVADEAAAWDEEVKEATALRYSATEFIRTNATAEEWDEALREAITLSYPDSAAQFDATECRPEFAEELETKDGWSHPADSGHLLEGLARYAADELQKPAEGLMQDEDPVLVLPSSVYIPDLNDDLLFPPVSPSTIEAEIEAIEQERKRRAHASRQYMSQVFEQSFLPQTVFTPPLTQFPPVPPLSPTSP